MCIYFLASDHYGVGICVVVGDMIFHIGLFNGILPWERSCVGINEVCAKSCIRYLELLLHFFPGKMLQKQAVLKTRLVACEAVTAITSHICRMEWHKHYGRILPFCVVFGV